MIRNEGIKPGRITHINLGYDFRLYQIPNSADVLKLKNELDSSVVLVTVGRFISIKRTEQSILLLHSLVTSGIDAKLVLLGSGEEQIALTNLASDLSLNGRILFKGHVTNVLDYISVSHFLIHPSISESSCVVVKESALVSVPVIACKGVGDFEEYILPNENGFLVDKDSFVCEGADIVKYYYNNPIERMEIGRRLKETVLNAFSVDRVVEKYHTISL
jgi:glycosyltransferase involved in cell wall biosynthesis